MSESELEGGKRWVEERLSLKAREAAIPIDKLSWLQQGDDFARDLHTLRFVSDQLRVAERFSSESLEDCLNGRKVRQKLDAQLSRLITRIRKGAVEDNLTTLERAVLEDAFIIFSQQIEFPQSLDFEIEQKRQRRLNAFDSLLGKGLLRHEAGKVKFSPLLFLRSRHGAAELPKLQRILPVLSSMYENGPENSHHIRELGDRISGLGLAPINGLTAQRLLLILEWLGFIHVNETQPIQGQNFIATFHIHPQIIRCEDLLEFLEAQYEALDSARTPPAAVSAAPARVGRKGPRTFETTFGAYDEVSHLGNGGAGTVFKVKDEDGGLFALKLIDRKKAPTEKLKRFKNEIGFCRKNSHVNIVQVIDDGLWHDGEVSHPFYVMPLYDGSLRDRIKAGIDHEDAVPLFGKILDGVQAAHLQSVWHRDLKPENILVDSGGRLVIADFGIARFEEDDLVTAVETSNEARLANFVYAAPEQRRKGGAVDHRADIFALGLILNELFTKEVAQGSGYKTISAILPEYGYLDPLVDRMIRQDVDQRPNSIADIKAELIRLGNEFISHQKLSQLKKTVIPADEIDDDLVRNPPTISNIDYRLGALTLYLSRPINDRWIEALRNMGSYQSIYGKGPEAFQIYKDTASIPASDEREVQAIVDSFKEWLPNANQKYRRMVEEELRQQQEAERRRLAQEIAEEERRQRILKNVKF